MKKTSLKPFFILIILIFVFLKSSEVTSKSNIPITDPPTNIVWDRLIGNNLTDYATSLVKTSDGGYAFGGSKESFTSIGYDFWLVKTDNKGVTLWEKTYDIRGSDMAYTMLQSIDEGFALAGIHSGLYNDACFLKVDKKGILEWNRTIGGPYDEEIHSMVQTHDQGFIITGSINSNSSQDIYLVKFSKNGDTEWNKTIGGESKSERAYAIIVTKDGGLALAGRASGSILLVKLSKNGEHEWNKTYSSTKGENEEVHSLIQTPEGDFLLAGATGVFDDQDDDVMLLKTDNKGNLIWTRTYGGNRDDFAYSVIQTVDGGFALFGKTASYGAGYSDFWLVKTDMDGIIEWNQTFGGNLTDIGVSVIQNSDESYVLLGRDYSARMYDCNARLLKIADTNYTENQTTELISGLEIIATVISLLFFGRMNQRKRKR